MADPSIKRFSIGLWLRALSNLSLCLFALAALGCRSSAAPKPTRDELNEQQFATLLSATPDELDFGTLARGSRQEFTFQLHNSGEESVTIETVRTSCDCLRIVPSTMHIEPGETASVTAVVDFADDPHFAGRLKLEAVGKGASNSKSFVLRCEVRVE